MWSSLILWKNNEKFLDWIVMWEEKWILYDSGNQLSGWTEMKLQSTSQSQTKERWWSLVACCPSDPLQLSESWRNHYIWEAQQINVIYWKLQHLQPTLINRKGLIFSMTAPDRMLHNQRFRSWTNRAITFCLIHHIHLTSPQPTTTSLSISTTFCRKNISTTTKRQKMPSKSLSNPEAWIFTLQE